MNTILLIEDSEECQVVVKGTLTEPQHRVLVAGTLEEARRLIADPSVVFDLVLLDLILPDGDGIELLGLLQSSRADVPVYLMTSKTDLDSKVSAFNLGAEDYLTKPFAPEELRARVEMRLRKRPRLRWGDLVLDMTRLTVAVVQDGREVPVALTSKEFRILAFLVQNAGRVYSRTQILREIWGESTHVIERTIDSHICGLRKKLGDAGNHIENIPGAGYRFNSESEANRHSATYSASRQ